MSWRERISSEGKYLKVWLNHPSSLLLYLKGFTLYAEVLQERLYGSFRTTLHFDPKNMLRHYQVNLKEIHFTIDVVRKVIFGKRELEWPILEHVNTLKFLFEPFWQDENRPQFISRSSLFLNASGF